jgi:hypothetical protein
MVRIANRSSNISLALTLNQDFFNSFDIIRDLRGKLLSGLISILV